MRGSLFWLFVNKDDISHRFINRLRPTMRTTWVVMRLIVVLHCAGVPPAQAWMPPVAAFRSASGRSRPPPAAVPRARLGAGQDGHYNACGTDKLNQRVSAPNTAASVRSTRAGAPPMPRRDAAVKAAQLAAASAAVLSGRSASAAKRQVKPVRSHPSGFAASRRQSG